LLGGLTRGQVAPAGGEQAVSDDRLNHPRSTRLTPRHLPCLGTLWEHQIAHR
jgi:hypothetical protein